MYYDLEHTRVESTFTAELELLVVVAARGVCLRSKGDSPLLGAHSFFFPSAKKRRRGRRSRAEHKVELAHARSIRGVSACSDPRLVYKTHLMMISGVLLENYSTPPGKIPAARAGRTTVYNEERCHFVPVSSRVFYRAHLAEWLRRSPAKDCVYFRVSHILQQVISFIERRFESFSVRGVISKP